MKSVGRKPFSPSAASSLAWFGAMIAGLVTGYGVIEAALTALPGVVIVYFLMVRRERLIEAEHRSQTGPSSQSEGGVDSSGA